MGASSGERITTKQTASLIETPNLYVSDLQERFCEDSADGPPGMRRRQGSLG